MTSYDPNNPKFIKSTLSRWIKNTWLDLIGREDKIIWKSKKEGDVYHWVIALGFFLPLGFVWLPWSGLLWWGTIRKIWLIYD